MQKRANFVSWRIAVRSIFRVALNRIIFSAGPTIGASILGMRRSIRRVRVSIGFRVAKWRGCIAAEQSPVGQHCTIEVGRG